MGMLDDATQKLDAVTAQEQERLTQERAMRERRLTEGARLAAEFLARATAADIRPDVEIREQRFRQTWSCDWMIHGGRSGVYHSPQARIGGETKECLGNEVVDHAWDLTPHPGVNGWKQLLLSSDGQVVTQHTEVIEDTWTQQFTYPDPLPLFVKEWREHPVYEPLLGNAVIPYSSYGDHIEVPVADAMVAYLRARTRP